MQTVQILLQLLNTLADNPAIISSLPMDDIRTCILAELDIRKELYSSIQLSGIKQDFIDVFAEMEQAMASMDEHTLLHYLEEIIFALQTFPDAGHMDEMFQGANFNQACLNHYRNDTVIVLGDSHVNFFSGNEHLSFLSIGNDINTCPSNTQYLFTPLHIGSCLAYNCNKYHTTFRFREKVEYLCKNFIKPGAVILCCLGEIDIRVHVFRQTAIQSTSYQNIIDNILTQYIHFMVELQSKGYTVYCWGPIASQKDSCPLDPQFPRNGSEEERNRATEYFTHQLSALCKERSIGFLSIFNHMITSEYKTLDKYLSSDRCHLSQYALSLAETEYSKINHPILPDNLL